MFAALNNRFRKKTKLNKWKLVEKKCCSLPIQINALSPSSTWYPPVGKGLGRGWRSLRDDFRGRGFQKVDGMFIKWGLTENLGGAQFSGKNY